MTTGQPNRTQIGIIHDALIARYGDARSAMLRTLYTWLNLTLLAVFGWPALVVFVDAPDATPELTPTDWFFVRLGILLVTAVLLARFWYVNRIPTGILRLSSMVALFSRGKIWPQVILFLLSLTILLSAVLLFRDTGPALKILSLGLLTTLIVQGLNAGYVYSTFQILEVERNRLRGTVVILMGLTFASSAATEAGIAINSESVEIAIAFVAGAGLGCIIGVVSVLFRERSESLAPAVLAQLLALSVVPAFFQQI